MTAVTEQDWTSLTCSQIVLREQLWRSARTSGHLSRHLRVQRVQGADGKWQTAAVIKQDWTSLNSWVLPKMPPLITDILISLDDRYSICPAISCHDLKRVILDWAAQPDLQQMLSWLGP